MIIFLNEMVKYGVKKLIFSSSAAVYGHPSYVPMDEKHPTYPVSPYGKSKFMVEQILEDYNRAYDLQHVCLRYFNAAGAHPDALLGERHCPETHLIPLAIGLNIDFFSLFSEWNPKVFIGGDNVIFWGPLAKTVIFGLTFATFLTLIIVPATFLITYQIKLKWKKLFQK